MATTNLETKQHDHALIMARFALDTVEAACDTLVDEEDPSLGYVDIRCGFNSGPGTCTRSRNLQCSHSALFSQSHKLPWLRK